MQVSKCTFVMLKGEKKGQVCGNSCKNGNRCHYHKEQRMQINREKMGQLMKAKRVVVKEKSLAAYKPSAQPHENFLRFVQERSDLPDSFTRVFAVNCKFQECWICSDILVDELGVRRDHVFNALIDLHLNFISLNTINEEEIRSKVPANSIFYDRVNTLRRVFHKNRETYLVKYRDFKKVLSRFRSKSDQYVDYLITLEELVRHYVEPYTNPRQMTILEFMEKAEELKCIPDDTIKIFKRSCELDEQGKWFTSDEVCQLLGYDNRSLTRALEHDFENNLDYKLHSDVQFTSGGRGRKTQFEISIDCIKELAIRKNKSVRKYYLALEKIIKAYHKYQLEFQKKEYDSKLLAIEDEKKNVSEANSQLRQDIESKSQAIESLKQDIESLKQYCQIYMIKSKEGVGAKSYVGSITSADLEEYNYKHRFKSHLYACNNKPTKYEKHITDYGKLNFTVELLFQTRVKSKTEARCLERYFYELHKCNETGLQIKPVEDDAFAQFDIRAYVAKSCK